MRTRNVIPFRLKKYKNETCTVDGITFHSRREADYYGQLKIEKRCRPAMIKDFERQVCFELRVNGELICKHYVDFLITKLDNTQEVREVKGFATDVWQIKRKLFEAIYPDIPYKVVR